MSTTVASLMVDVGVFDKLYSDSERFPFEGPPFDMFTYQTTILKKGQTQTSSTLEQGLIFKKPLIRRQGCLI